MLWGKMNILYLVDKKTYNTKMSRVRFHGMEAISNRPDTNLLIRGKGWKNFSGCKNIDKEYGDKDILVWYKPLDMDGYDKVKKPKCIRYNEMWNKEWTAKEIRKSNSGLVICHHFNDIHKYNGLLNPDKFKLVHNPHCADTRYFKPYFNHNEKNIDVLLVGITSKKFYPLRYKIKKKVLPILKEKGFNAKLYSHPGYEKANLREIDKQVIKYAKTISRSKIVITCASKYKYALAKYPEIAMCRTAICASIPNENKEWYKNHVIGISNELSSKTITNKIIWYLSHKKKLKHITNIGYEENLKHRKQQDYARRFVFMAQEYLDGKMNNYDFTKNPERYLNGGDDDYK